MSGSSVTLEPANRSRLPYVERLLEENGLPVEDVRSKPEVFSVAFVEGHGEEEGKRKRIGIGGLEPFGTVGLLRSVVIEPPKRGNGYGAALCEALEAEASTEGVRTLYLLTTTAAEFFAERGYVVVERADAPAPIRQTTEFEDLCPDTATCMKKRL